MPISDQLRDAIRDSELSAYAVSKATGVSQSQLSRFLHDERTLSLPAADKLAEFFQMRLTRPVKPKV